MPSLSSFCAVENPGSLLDQEGRDTWRAGGGIDLRVDDEDIGGRAVRDPHLVAIQHVAVADASRACACPSRPSPRPVRSSRAHEVLAADQLRQVTLLLLLRAASLLPVVSDSQSAVWICERSILDEINLVGDVLVLYEEIKIEAMRNPNIGFMEIFLEFSSRSGENKFRPPGMGCTIYCSCCANASPHYAPGLPNASPA